MLKRWALLGLFMIAGMIVMVGCYGNEKPCDKCDTATCSCGTHAAKTMSYIEKEHNGRIYVIGNEETAKKLEDNGHIPYAKTIIGKGPGGKTVVIEIDKDKPEMTEQLLAEFNKKHNLDIK